MRKSAPWGPVGNEKGEALINEVAVVAPGFAPGVTLLQQPQQPAAAATAAAAVANTINKLSAFPLPCLGFSFFDLLAISTSDCNTLLLLTLSELAQYTVLTQYKLCHHYAG